MWYSRVLLVAAAMFAVVFFLPTLVVAQIQITAEPGFDIVEIPPGGEFFDSPVPDNLARASAGALFFGSSQLGAPNHLIEHINDGLYGNSNSWIPQASDPNPFVGVEFSGSPCIGSIAWGRDNNTGVEDGGIEFMDRWEGTYFIEVTSDANVAQDPNAASWTLVGSVLYSSPTGGRALWRRHQFSLAQNGQPISARALRIRVDDTSRCIDELEAYEEDVQFVGTGTFNGCQTLGNQGNTGPQGNQGGTGSTGGVGQKGFDGSGGTQGFRNFDVTCIFVQSSGEPQAGFAGGTGGTGGTGGVGGIGGPGGVGGEGGSATWSFANGSSFINNGVVDIGGVPGVAGGPGSGGSASGPGSGGSLGKSGGRGGNGGYILPPTNGANGAGAHGGSGGINAFDLFRFNGGNGGHGGSPNGGGGGGGGGEVCEIQFFAPSITGRGGSGGPGHGGHGGTGGTGSTGTNGGGGGPGGPGAPVVHPTTGSFANNGTITIGGKGGTGGTGGTGGNGGNGGRGGDGGDGGGGGGAAGGRITDLAAAQGASGGGGGSGGTGGSPGGGGAGGAGGSAGSAGDGIIEILAGASVLNSNSGTITVHANGTLTNRAGGTFNNDGTINASAISNWTNDGTLTGTGLIIGDFINEGTFAPGDSPGVHAVNGDYTEQGTLEIEIGGLIAGTEYDVVDVIGSSGNVVLNSLTSTLDISFLDGFDPRELVVGDEFDIIRYTGSVAGTFSAAFAPFGSPVVFEVDYAADGSVTLRVTEVCPLSMTLQRRCRPGKLGQMPPHYQRKI